MDEGKHNPDLELMLRYDGESESADAGSDAADADAKLAALGAFSAAFRDAMTVEIDDGMAGDSFVSMWSEIEHRIAANGASHEPAVLEVPRAAAEQVSPGLFESIRAWFESYRSQALTGAVCAAAAALVVWFIRPPEKTIEYVEVRASAPAVIPVSYIPEAAEVESLEVYDGSGIVLTIPSDGDESAPTTVIWLSQPENSVEGPI